ncbi:MAG: esterase-like activity of phytase family protein, partial [Asticcacaulis sp.]|nr:esterase-like activity of phytase family protein [Asticcacaulis sp.]
MKWSRLAALGLLLALPACSEPVQYGSESVGFRPLAASDPHPLNAKVRYAAGYEIDARGTAQLEGLSDLVLTPQADGLRVVALSDFGAILSFDLKPGGQGFGDSPVTIELLRNGDGHVAVNRDLNDSEDIAVAPDGTRYVSYERFQRIAVFAPGQTWIATPATLPLTGMTRLPNNEGLEGLAVIGGQLLAGAESGGFWICDRGGAGCRSVDGPSVPGFMYKLSSLAPVPGHDDEVLALYRYFDPFTGHLRNVLSLLRLKDGRLFKVKDLLKVAPPLPADNYEGVAAVPQPGGYRLYLLSDSLKDDGK